MYTIGEVSKMFNLPIPTLRFYDKEGLLIDLERNEAGIRKFNDKSLEALKVIDCLKKSGLQIKEIKEFMHWCTLGDQTLEQRKEMFLRQKETMENEIQELEKALDMIKFKCWYYETATKAGSEEVVKTISASEMPNHIQKLYEDTHSIVKPE
ncbi:MerR family transcriptional regulator [Breznakia pachnodae]|uniref:DNA-binding transcriptional MerR regulator n=1 Tax=Breznakia pachnodae TaxID=265178 RepID=A0ABU0E2D6_9FIRM|nr:MerR family transcriptional regulator [Breznakia pachnodae]MDQ0361062.1 DNA-binding transcriptional MerR regulator [Breznakia pachnodae]